MKKCMFRQKECIEININEIKNEIKGAKFEGSDIIELSNNKNPFSFPCNLINHFLIRLTSNPKLLSCFLNVSQISLI